MADNMGVSEGSGITVAMDEITDGGVAQGAKVQRVKAGHGENNFYKDTSDTDPYPSKLHKITVPSGTPGRNVSVTSGTVLKSGATKLKWLYVSSSATAKRFLKFYDKNSNPNPASDLPVLVLGISAGADGPIPFDISGISFVNGMAVLCTSVNTDTSTAYAAANEMVISWSAD